MQTKKLIKNIRDLLIQYEKETGLIVTDIQVFLRTKNCSFDKNNTEYDISITVGEE